MTKSAMRRLEIQDAQFAEISEQLLDMLELRQDDRVVELGIGSGGLGRRIMRRLGTDGVLVGVDYTQELLDQAIRNLSGTGTGHFEATLADIRHWGPWITGADVVVGRTVLHHVPMVEALLGSLRCQVRPGTRIGFVEPEFRALIGRIAALEAEGRSEFTPLRIWAEAINRYYQACGLSPDIGARLALTLRAAGFRDVRTHWSECPLTKSGVENMLLFYDEVREKYISQEIMTAGEIDQQKQQISALGTGNLPAVWGAHAVACIA